MGTFKGIQQALDDQYAGIKQPVAKPLGALTRRDAVAQTNGLGFWERQAALTEDGHAAPFGKLFGKK